MNRPQAFSLRIVVATMALFFTLSCDTLNKILPAGELSNDEIIKGLKEALTVGTDSTTTKLNKVDGYLGNALIKILLPPETAKIQAVANSIPFIKTLLDNLIIKMNRAAEEAAKDAAPIFVDAIKGITIADGLTILKGDSVAATRYLNERTYSSLNGLYKPKIEAALTNVGAQQAYADVINAYNDLPLVTPIQQSDLAQHVTDKALDGLYLVIGQYETKIRKDITYRVTELLKKVFAKQ